MRHLFRFLIFLFTLNFSPHLFSYELGVATMFRDEGNYLKEWIEYHRMVGVDHFWLYNDRSSDQWMEVLQPYIEEGLVEIINWPLTSRNFYYKTQAAALKDALKRSKGIATWLAFIDIDEFMLPMKDATVTECLKNHFYDAHAVYLSWRCFGTGGVYVPKEKPLLFQLTACSLKNHSKNCIGKSIMRPDFVDIDQVWYPHTCPLKEGALYLNGDRGPMQFEGTIVKTDGFSHTNFIRINHYVMRDENYFQNVRLARARNGYDGYAPPEEDLLLQLNKEFSLMKDHAIINFIKKHHPDMHEKFWK